MSPLPAHGTDHVSEEPPALSHTAALRYGLLGLPLAFVALPLYVHLPNVYAQQHGLSLATLGAVFLLARMFDAVTDPWLGRVSDRLYARSPSLVLGSGAVAAALLVLGMALLLFPPWPEAHMATGLLVMLMLTSLLFSLLTISHQAWGARLGGGELQRTRIVAWREGAALCGVVLASSLPSLLGWSVWLGVFALALSIACWAWSRSTRPAAATLSAAQVSDDWRTALVHPWRHAPFRRLMAVFVISGLASAVPAALVLFFVQDRLVAPQYEALFLATYFVAAAASLPLWMRSVARFGLLRSWLLGMLLSVLVFIWAALLGQGDVLAFAAVCALSGMALGADLAVPGALLAGQIAQNGDKGQREGAYFGWWNLAGKLNLALAAGLALPLLQWLGYQSGSGADASSPQGLFALTLAYAVLPCGLKLLAAALLYTLLLRPAKAAGVPSVRSLLDQESS